MGPLIDCFDDDTTLDQYTDVFTILNSIVLRGICFLVLPTDAQPGEL